MVQVRVQPILSVWPLNPNMNPTQPNPTCSLRVQVDPSNYQVGFWQTVSTQSIIGLRSGWAYTCYPIVINPTQPYLTHCHPYMKQHRRIYLCVCMFSPLFLILGLLLLLNFLTRDLARTIAAPLLISNNPIRHLSKSSTTMTTLLSNITCTIHFKIMYSYHSESIGLTPSF